MTEEGRKERGKSVAGGRDHPQTPAGSILHLNFKKDYTRIVCSPQ